MKPSFDKLLAGYKRFREKYVHGDDTILQTLAYHGQQPQTMVVACCDSRVDPALILQCDPGDLFVVRNVANIVPPYELDNYHHGTSAALEFGICYLNIKHLVLLGHSQCGGIQGLLDESRLALQNDFISNWLSVINKNPLQHCAPDDYAKVALNYSYEHCLTFPWIKSRIENKKLCIHRWFFDIKDGQILSYNDSKQSFLPLSDDDHPNHF